jgi:hypothetical protein
MLSQPIGLGVGSVLWRGREAFTKLSMTNNTDMKTEIGPPRTESRSRFSGPLRSFIGLLDFLICVYLVSLFFQGTMPGKQQLKEAFRQVYSFMLDPENLIITSVIGLRLSIYGISRHLKFKASSKSAT